MEAQIQYARTSDEVSIAYTSAGSGLPLVVLPSLPFSHIELELQMFRNAPAWYQGLGRGRQLVRYDPRGAGLSDRGRAERDMDSMLLDLDAVLDALKLDRVALQATFYAVPVAVAYAARNPARVSHLLTFCGVARARDLRSPQLMAIRSLIDKEWELYSETAANLFLGWEQGPPARRLAEFIRDSASPQSILNLVNAGYDVTELLPQVQAPTLVQYRRSIPWLPIDVVRSLAIAIPDSRLEILEGSSIAAYLGDNDAVLHGIDAFLGHHGAHLVEEPASSLRIILFTDLEDHAGLLSRLGEKRGHEVLREHERITREAFLAYRGQEIGPFGDGFIASFMSAQAALECAGRLHRESAAWNQAHAEQLAVRIGANVGEPTAGNDSLYGESIVAASRIAARAAGGEVLVSNVVRELAAGKGFLFAQRGQEVLGGFDDPVQIYALRWRNQT